MKPISQNNTEMCAVLQDCASLQYCQHIVKV